jgi:phospholipase/carboxylesterase
MAIQTTTQTLETLEISGTGNIDSSVIWLHGLGADGHDFEPFVRELQLPHTRFILPHAAYRPVTINDGYVMRAWYDIFELGLGSKQDAQGIRQAQLQIEALIAREQVRGIAANRIVLAGFSQGGALALHTALRYPQRLAGVMVLSAYLALQSELVKEAHKANRQLPIFMAHGSFDEIIGMDVCKASLNTLNQQGYVVDWHEYAMGHSVCGEELQDIHTFLCAILSNLNKTLTLA